MAHSIVLITRARILPDWTPERDRLLVSLWHRGDGINDIAAIFKTTKNAILGRKWRLKKDGWHIRNTTRNIRGGRPRKNGTA